MSEIKGYEPSEHSNDAEKSASQHWDGEPIIKEGEQIGAWEFNKKIGRLVPVIDKDVTQAFDRAVHPHIARKIEPSETKSKREQLIRKHEDMNREEGKNYLGVKED